MHSKQLVSVKNLSMRGCEVQSCTSCTRNSFQTFSFGLSVLSAASEGVTSEFGGMWRGKWAYWEAWRHIGEACTLGFLSATVHGANGGLYFFCEFCIAHLPSSQILVARPISHLESHWKDVCWCYLSPNSTLQLLAPSEAETKICSLLLVS